MTNYSLITLGELLSSESPIIQKHALGIAKQLQKDKHETIDIYDAENPFRKKAIKIINSFACLERLEGEPYYDAEDAITLIIAE
jgi:hypothetical protein